MLLKDKHRAILHAIFSAVPTPIEVWAFGSRVNGSAHDASDLDLVLRTPHLQPLPRAEYSACIEKLRECNVPYIVQLFDWARLPQSFHQNIEAQYEVIFKR